MQDKVRRLFSRVSSGQSLVELALLLPVLLLMFLGLVELGFLLHAHLVVANANREAARFAARGRYTDEQIAQRAIISFASQLPYKLDGADANTEILVTRFSFPADPKQSGTYYTPYITGTLGLSSQIDPAVKVKELEAEHKQFNEDLVKSQSDAVRTAQDMVLVEIYYYHYEVLHAPIIEWLFPDPMVVYAHTWMRIGPTSGT